MTAYLLDICCPWGCSVELVNQAVHRNNGGAGTDHVAVWKYSHGEFTTSTQLRRLPMPSDQRIEEYRSRTPRKRKAA